VAPEKRFEKQGFTEYRQEFRNFVILTFVSRKPYCVTIGHPLFNRVTAQDISVITHL